MATALVVRIQRRKFLGDPDSPMVYALKRKNRDAKTYDLDRLGTSNRNWWMETL